jgi:alpha-L-rhamnosidase
MYGPISSGWKLEGEKLTMDVEIPANTSASIHIPGSASGIQVNGEALSGTGIDFKETEGSVIGKVGSGKYTIVSRYSN